jgi:hypothetical protein
MLRHHNNVLHATPLVPTVRARIPLLKKLLREHQDLDFPEKIVFEEPRETRRMVAAIQDISLQHPQIVLTRTPHFDGTRSPYQHLSYQPG